MLIFQEKELFFQTLHPATTLIYLAVIILGAAVLNHPLFLLILFIPVFAALAVAGCWDDWLHNARFFFALIFILFLINIMTNRLGNTVLFWGPLFPVLGRITVTLEALVFALVMGIRLLTIFTAFMFYNHVINPDRALSMFAKLFPRSALLVALTTKTIPFLSRKLQNVGEIAQCRGINFYTGSLFIRIKNRLPLMRVLLISALEDSFNIGESIRARAYGSGPRTNYFYHRWHLGDTLVNISSIFASLIVIVSLGCGWGSYSFYPSLGKIIISPYQVVTLLILFIALLNPVLLAWGWNKWNFLK